MIKAGFIKDLEGWTGTAKLWKVGNSHVVTSAAIAMFTGPETYVFGCDEEGEVADFEELEGSYRGDLDHDRAISGHVDSLNSDPREELAR